MESTENLREQLDASRYEADCWRAQATVRREALREIAERLDEPHSRRIARAALDSEAK